MGIVNEREEAMREALWAEVHHKVTLMELELHYMGEKCSVGESTRRAWIQHEEVGQTYVEWKLLVLLLKHYHEVAIMFIFNQMHYY